MPRLKVSVGLMVLLFGTLAPAWTFGVGKFAVITNTLAAEDPCVEARRLFNEALGMNEASRERELLEKALTLPCQDNLTSAYILNNLGDALERLGQRDEALRHYAEAYILFPYADPIRKNLVRLLDGLDETTSRRLCSLSRVQEAKELVRKLDLRAHKTQLRTWRKIAVEWAAPDKPPESGIGQTEPVTPASSEVLPPPPQGLSWLPTVIIYFDFDSDVLRPEAAAQLKELSAALQSPALKGNRFRLEGHTCDLGSEAYNQRLSERRAMSVKRWLIRSGVSSQQLMVRGYGRNRPIFSNTEGTRHLNRRVQVVTVATQVASAPRQGSVDWLRQDLERVAKLIEQGACEEAAAILDRLEAQLPDDALGAAKARIAANRALINLCRGVVD